MALNSLQELFVHELKDIYDAEKQLVKAIPKMAQAATCEKLQQGIEEHLEQTRGQVDRLEQVFESIGAAARAQKCDAMAGLVKEAKSLLEEKADSDVMDAAIIAAAQKIEHYEIAAYGTLCVWAKQLGFDEAAALLGETLDQEKQTDATLTHLAETEVNLAAETA